MKTSLQRIAILAMCIAIAGCSGGGGDGGGDSQEGSLSRSTATGIRIVHGSVDEIPVSVFVDGSLIQSAHYAESTRYRRVSAGAVTLSVQGANAPDFVFTNSSVELKKNTEYSLFVYGSASAGRAAFTLLEDPVLRSAETRGMIQVLNGYQGGGTFEVSSNISGAIGNAEFGGTTGFTDVPSGVHSITVARRGGGIIATVPVDVIDRGDVTLLITGSADLGVVFTPVYQDLD